MIIIKYDRLSIPRGKPKLDLEPLNAERLKIGPDLVPNAVQRLQAVIDRLTGDHDEVHSTVHTLAGDVDAVQVLDRWLRGFGERFPGRLPAKCIPHVTLQQPVISREQTARWV